MGKEELWGKIMSLIFDIFGDTFQVCNWLC